MKHAIKIRTICNEVTQPNVSLTPRMPKRWHKNRQTTRKSTANYLHRFDHIYWKNAHQNQRRQRTFLCQLENKILNSLIHERIQVSTWTWNDGMYQLYHNVVTTLRNKKLHTIFGHQVSMKHAWKRGRYIAWRQINNTRQKHQGGNVTVRITMLTTVTRTLRRQHIRSCLRLHTCYSYSTDYFCMPLVRHLGLISVPRLSLFCYETHGMRPSVLWIHVSECVLLYRCKGLVVKLIRYRNEEKWLYWSSSSNLSGCTKAANGDGGRVDAYI